MRPGLRLSILLAVLAASVSAYYFCNGRRPPAPPRAQTTTARNPARPPQVGLPASATNPAPTAMTTAPVPKDKISKAVATILGLDPEQKDYRSRSKAMHRLTRQLSAADVTALRQFLEARADNQNDMNPLAFNGLKNDVLDILLRQLQIPDGLGRDLVSMYRNASHDDMWRDYCVQYMGACYEAIQPTGVATNEPDLTRAEIARSYWDAIAKKDKTIAGTSLIALEQLSRNHPELERKKVGETALTFATDEGCSEAARITALRVCGTMGRTEVLPAARVAAQAGDSVSLQAAAIATIGDLGEPQDAELLSSMAGSREPRIQKVAEAACARLAARNRK